MLARLTGALAASLVLLSVPVAMAAGGLDRDAQRVYDDYRSDGRIEPCRHTVAVYRATLEQITDAIDQDEPAFRPSAEAALEAREHESCDGDKPASSGNSSSPSGSGTSQGGTTGTGAPAPATGDSAPVAPTNPPAGEGDGGESAAPVTPGTGGAPAPEGAAVPVPAAAAPGTTEQVLVNRPYEGTPLGLLIAAALLACALLAWLAALAARRFGWGEERLAGARHAWGEAAFRAGGTWSDFLDWVRVGR